MELNHVGLSWCFMPYFQCMYDSSVLFRVLDAQMLTWRCLLAFPSRRY